MKPVKTALLALGIFMLSFIAFYACNCLFMVVSNYEALDIVSLAGIPMLLIFINLMIGLVAGYRYFMKKEPDLYYVRYYAIVLLVMSVVGFGMSLFVGLGIYHTFIGDYIFKCYPLISLIVFALMIAGCIYLIISITNKVKAENIEKTYKGTFAYGMREAGLGILTAYALNRLGAFMLIPFYWSSYDSVYVLPYLFQLLVPTLIIATYIIHEDFLRNRKVTFILSSIAFLFSLATLIYMVVISKDNYPLILNPLSPVQQFERLVKFPIDAILMYGVCLIIPFLNALNNGIMMLKEKKAKKAE